MQEYILGQRWISDAESQMGLGTVMTVEHRSVTIVFLATGETRTYSKQTAPLRRVSFGIGDSIVSHEGWTMIVESVREEGGLIRYQGKKEDGTPAELPEEQLDNHIQLNRATDRLFNGKVDAEKWFELRYQTLFHLNRLAHHPLRGITGGRTALIPHQIYIAHEVTNRYAPRVLLADEVGLGKTIEAGMILHQQYLTERARRILIVVPETLVHQWFVEMMRRFNLHFSIFDEERCVAYEAPLHDEMEAGEKLEENPFFSEQLVLCSLDFLVAHPNRYHQSLQGEWDIMVVDEAHHLQWSADEPSTEYAVVEGLAKVTKGVLLLTATPEQLGSESHFARLRLLDHNRFSDYQKFLNENKTYEPIAHAIDGLINESMDKATINTLTDILQRDEKNILSLLGDDALEEKQDVIDKLLDQNGTGRVLFRNTRSAIKGFPARKLIQYKLPLPEKYAEYYNGVQNLGLTDMQQLLSPEQLLGTAVLSDDPRFAWLLGKLDELRNDKILLICAYAETALKLAALIKKKTGKTSAVFHEGLSIVERDRAAAFFADKESTCRLLICSEIGSEGRNFQFSHHLILFDLPFDPDLLEQRIGRLDRIGQQNDIQIHVPVMGDSPQFIMCRWYHEGLNAFENTCPAAHIIFEKTKPLLVEAIHQLDEGLQDLENLIGTTRNLNQELSEQLSRGRDKLLEYNSCRPKPARELHRLAEESDKNVSPMEYMERVYECYGIDYEDQGSRRYLIRPSAHMQMQNFPGLMEEGMSICYERDVALGNEDVHFVSWDHPLVNSSMELVLSQEQGNTGLLAIKYPGMKPGQILLEGIFVLEPAPNPVLQSSRYLPPSMIRVVVDQQGKDHAQSLVPEAVVAQQVLEQDTIEKIIKSQNHLIRKLIDQCESMAAVQAPQIIQDAHQAAERLLNQEIDRLQSLIRVNPNVRQEEIVFFQQQKQALDEAIDSVNLRLDAIRVLVVLA